VIGGENFDTQLLYSLAEFKCLRLNQICVFLKPIRRLPCEPITILEASVISLKKSANTALGAIDLSQNTSNAFISQTFDAGKGKKVR
jgi:hypothetical protein